MSDLIRRQAAIDAIGELCSCTLDEEARWREIIGSIPSAQQDVARDIATIIENEQDMRVMLESKPTAQQKPRWVPVSERLPEDGVSVLVCCGGDMTDGVHDEGDWWIAKEDRVYSDEEGVIDAWMPLPEPYKEEK